MGNINENITNFKKAVNQSHKRILVIMFIIFIKIILIVILISPDKEPDNFDNQYFRLWVMEKQNPALSKQLDSLILMIDNFDVVLEVFSPLIEEAKDLGMELVGAIPE